MPDLSNTPSSSDAPWYAAYPAPRNANPPTIARSDVLSLMQSGARAGRDFILVDLRRMDHEGGTIRGSINLPAQSLYPTLPTLYTLFKGAGVKTVIWYCGSSRGRGNRAAGWFEDCLDERGEADMKSVALEGGIKGWVGGGEEYQEYMDEYVAEVWRK